MTREECTEKCECGDDFPNCRFAVSKGSGDSPSKPRKCTLFSDCEDFEIETSDGYYTTPASHCGPPPPPCGDITDAASCTSAKATAFSPGCKWKAPEMVHGYTFMHWACGDWEQYIYKRQGWDDEAGMGKFALGHDWKDVPLPLPPPPFSPIFYKISSINKDPFFKSQYLGDNFVRHNLFKAKCGYSRFPYGDPERFKIVPGDVTECAELKAQCAEVSEGAGVLGNQGVRSGATSPWSSENFGWSRASVDSTTMEQRTSWFSPNRYSKMDIEATRKRRWYARGGPIGRTWDVRAQWEAVYGAHSSFTNKKPSAALSQLWDDDGSFIPSRLWNGTNRDQRSFVGEDPFAYGFRDQERANLLNGPKRQFAANAEVSDYYCVAMSGVGILAEGSSFTRNRAVSWKNGVYSTCHDPYINGCPVFAKKVLRANAGHKGAKASKVMEDYWTLGVQRTKDVGDAPYGWALGAMGKFQWDHEKEPSWPSAAALKEHEDVCLAGWGDERSRFSQLHSCDSHFEDASTTPPFFGSVVGCPTLVQPPGGTCEDGNALGEPESSCFHGSNEFLYHNGTAVPASELRVGDRIMVLQEWARQLGQAPVSAEIIGWAVRPSDQCLNAPAARTFVEIKVGANSTANSSTADSSFKGRGKVVVTEFHHIRVDPDVGQTATVKHARDVRAGDRIWLHSVDPLGGAASWGVVHAVREFREATTAYTPITDTGTNFVMASGLAVPMDGETVIDGYVLHRNYVTWFHNLLLGLKALAPSSWWESVAAPLLAPEESELHGPCTQTIALFNNVARALRANSGEGLSLALSSESSAKVLEWTADHVHEIFGLDELPSGWSMQSASVAAASLALRAATQVAFVWTDGPTVKLDITVEPELWVAQGQVRRCTGNLVASLDYDCGKYEYARGAEDAATAFSQETCCDTSAVRFEGAPPFASDAPPTTDSGGDVSAAISAASPTIAPEDEDSSGMGAGIIVLITLLVLGAFSVFVVVRRKKQNRKVEASNE